MSTKFDAKEEAIEQMRGFLPYGPEMGIPMPTDWTGYTVVNEYWEKTKPLREDYWKRFDEINRALNWTVLNGPFPAEYWTDVEPLEHYKWEADDKAVDDLKEMLEKLPSTVYYDEDGCVYTDDPYMDSENWDTPEDEATETCPTCGTVQERPEYWEPEPIYIGPENYYETSVTKLLLHKEVVNTFFGY